MGILCNKNRTTIEFCEGKEDGKYNFGFIFNWIQIFGKNPLGWFLPIFPLESKNGLEFKSKTLKQKDSDDFLTNEEIENFLK